MNNEVNVGKKEVFGAFSVDKIYKSDYQKEGTMTAAIRQVVTTTYPSSHVSSSLQDNIFDAVEDFGFKGESYDSARVAFLDVPPNTTPEALLERLRTRFPNARIQRRLSSQPILTTQQEYAIANGITTLEVIANSQVVKVDDKIQLDAAGKPQYRVTVFKTNEHEIAPDLDLRDDDPDNTYVTPEIAAMIASLSGEMLTSVEETATMQ